MKTKMMNRLAIAYILFLTTAGFVQAQNMTTATIQWNASQLVNVQTGEKLRDPGMIVTTAKEKLDWLNMDGSVRYSFSVKEVIGNWTNVTKNGSMTYEIAGEAGNGTATFEKTSAEIKIRLLFTKESDPQFFELTITTVEIK